MSKKQILISIIIAGFFFALGLIFRHKERKTTDKQEAQNYEFDAAIMFLLSLIGNITYVIYCIVCKYM